MNTDDKFGISAGLMAIGLAAGVILLGQLTYNKDYEEQMAKAAVAAADAKDASGKVVAEAAVPVKPVTMGDRFYALIPHRELVRPEAIFDGIVCLLALPGGIILFVLAIFGSTKEAGDAEPAVDQSPSS